MSDMTDDELDAIDFAVVAYRDEGEWSLQELNITAVDSIDSIATELRRFPGEAGALAMLAIDEDFVILVRSNGADTKVLLSDASATSDWILASSAMARIGVHIVDLEEQVPAGDLGIVADLGMSASDMGELLDDLDLFPEEVLSEIADRLGFGEKFDDLVGIEA